MSFNEFIKKYNINPSTYVWLCDDSLDNKRVIYLYDYAIITTKALYTLIFDEEDESIKQEVGNNIQLIDYTDLSPASIPNDKVKNIILEFIEVSNIIIK